MGFDIGAALLCVTRDVTRIAAVKGSIDDENTILCETNNAKLLERTRWLPANENKRREISFAHFPFDEHRFPVDVATFPSHSIVEIARNERKGPKCRLDFTARDFRLVTS